MRQTLRRLKKTVESAEKSDEAAAPAGSSLAALKSALTGGAASSSSAAAPATGARALAKSIPIDIIRGSAPPKKVKKLRYTFNTGLREARLDADLEDLTDDEEEQRLGIVEEDEEFERPVAAPQSEVIHADEETGEVVEEAGMKKASDKPLPKKLNHITEERYRDGSIGLYDSDPALHNAKREKSHRRGEKKKSRASAALAATTPGDYSSGSSKAGGAKATYRFWSK